MISHISTVAVYVENQQNALLFWTEKVGFEVFRNEPMGPGGNWIEVGPKGSQSHLVIYPKSMMPNWENQKASVVFACNDAQSTYNQLKEKGVEFTQELNKMQWGTFAVFRDEEGNEFVLKG